MAEQDELILVGAGLVGALVATLLQAKGYRVSVFERYQDIRSIPSAGRSINLSATARGLRALDLLPVAVKDALLALGTKVTGRIIHTDTEHVPGGGIFQRYGKDDTEYNYSISRYELNKFLIQSAEDAGVNMNFGHKLADMDLSGEWPVLKFTLEDGSERVVKCNGPVIGADGGGSGVRYAMKKLGLCDFGESMLPEGYKEMIFPGEPAQTGKMARHGLHIWPRGSHMLMGLANLDGSFTGTLYMNNSAGEDSFKSIEEGGTEKAQAFLEKHYRDAIPLLGGNELACKQLVENGRGILGTVRTDNWHVGGKVAILGDAAHAIVPFFGQGMNCGFEDARVLVNILDKHAPAGSPKKDYAAAFAEFEAARKPNANAIADMALENYVEMQSATADPHFLVCKAVENAIENSELGPRFISRYAMVCYGGDGNVTYSAAQQLGRVQWEIVCELAKDLSSVDQVAAKLDLSLAAQLLDQKLTPLQLELGVDLSTVRH